MIVSYIAIGILTFASIMLAGALIRARSREIEAGIIQNPPTFIEVLEGKPMMIRVDSRFVFKVRHPSSVVSIRYLNRLRSMFALLKKTQSGEYTTLKEKAIQGIYVSIAFILYNMSKGEYKGIDRLRYRRALVMRCVQSTEWMTEVVSQINDYWRLVKKKEAYQAAGGTLRLINGDHCTWDLLQKVSRFTN